MTHEQEELYSAFEECRDKLDNITFEDIIKAFGSEDGAPIESETALIHHQLDGLLVRIENITGLYDENDLIRD